DRWFRVLPISPTGCSADLTLTPFISTASHRSPAAMRVAIRTEPGPRWGDGSAMPASLIGLRASATGDPLPMAATPPPPLGRPLSGFVIGDYARPCGSTWLRQFYGAPLPHVAASTVLRRCRGPARRDVTALGVSRSATVLFSPRRQGNVNSIRWIDMTLWFG